jgi:hypothetical protein
VVVHLEQRGWRSSSFPSTGGVSFVRHDRDETGFLRLEGHLLIFNITRT